jgi:hypothetical protein
MIKQQSLIFISLLIVAIDAAPAPARWLSSQSAPVVVPTPTTAALHKLQNRPAEPIAPLTSEMGPTLLGLAISAILPSLYFDPASCQRNATRRSEGSKWEHRPHVRSDHVMSYDHLVEISLEDRQAVTNFDKRRIPKNVTRNPKADHGPHLH